MKIGVVIPTYRRPQELKRCLEALKVQTRQPDELWIVVRDTDTETWTFLETFNPEPLPLHTVTVKITGVVAAMNAGLNAAKTDIIAFTDDDAAPHADWLERIESAFMSDDLIGGVGGRDWVYHGTKLIDGAAKVVGKLQWFGRVIGNHHAGVGEAREVDALKGVNMSFRRSAIARLHFEERARGTGAQVHFELPFCLALKRAGWKVIYDPAIGVDHYPGQRFDEDRRNKFNDVALSNAVHNETLALLEHLSAPRRTLFLLWALLIGTQEAVGFLQWLRFLPSQGAFASQKWFASIRGRWRGWQTWQESKYGNNSYNSALENSGDLE